MQVVEYVEIKVGGRKVKLKVEKQLNIVKIMKLPGLHRVLKMVVIRTEKMLMTTTQVERPEKVMLVTRVEKYRLEVEMAVLCSSVWMAMACCLCENGGYRMT